MNGARYQKGLSLLELLVVFVIISLVSTVLVQGFGFGLALYERVQTRTDRMANELLVNHWFRSSLESLVAGKTVETALAGEAATLTGVTLSSLISAPGSPVYFEWHLGDDELLYKEGESELIVRDLGGVTHRFEYLDDTGVWQPNWTPSMDKLDLPVAVRIVVQGETLVLAAVRSRLKPDLLLEDSRRER